MPCRSMNEQFRVNRRAAGMAVELGQVRSDAVQVHKPVNRSQEVVLRDVVVERELIKQCRLANEDDK